MIHSVDLYLATGNYIMIMPTIFDTETDMADEVPIKCDGPLNRKNNRY